MMSLKDTKRRINGVKNTQKITRAMKLVSSAKFARANQAFYHSQPYRKTFEEVLSRVVGKDSIEHPFLVSKKEKKNLYVLLSTDRGFCGGLNSNLLKFTQSLLRAKEQEGITADLLLWGRKAKGLEKSVKNKIIGKVERILDRPTYAFSAATIQQFSTAFFAEQYDAIFLIYPSFKNVILQQPKMIRLLPMELGELEEQAPENGFIFEPSIGELLPEMLEKYLNVLLFQILLESSVSEHAARMSAMDSATNNADDVIKKLTLNYNRARQAAITKELIEITSGAEAL